MKKVIVVFLSSILLTALIGCNGKTASYDSEINDSVIDSNTFCNIHNNDCEKQAKDLDMTLDEYHIWSENYQKGIDAEDEMTNENVDIVDPNSSVESPTQKQWVNCKNCSGTGYQTCNGCMGEGRTSNCTYCYAEGCSRCGWNGKQICYHCKGTGNNGKCNECDGRGQVLMEF